jgi:hypothetical protein
METLLHNSLSKTAIPYTEIDKIATFYGFSHEQIDEVISPLSEFFQEYYELVFASEEVELITSGKGELFAGKIIESALRAGLTHKSVDFFTACHLHFPEVVTGIKFRFSKKGSLIPALYVRVKCKMEEAMPFLRKQFSSEELKPLCEALKGNTILYGLGFSEKSGEGYLKTYTIGEVENENGEKIQGFISHRLSGNQFAREYKTYLPEVILSDFKTQNHVVQNLIYFLVHGLSYTKAGHIGILHRDNEADEYKIYVERIGGIPTDFSAR